MKKWLMLLVPPALVGGAGLFAPKRQVQPAHSIVAAVRLQPPETPPLLPGAESPIRRDVQGVERVPAEETADSRRVEGFALLLLHWRDGIQSEARDREIEDEVAASSSKELTAAAARTLLNHATQPAHIDALCAILAADGGPLAVETLLEAAQRGLLRESALAHLSSIGAPEAALPLSRALPRSEDVSLLRAMGRALGGMDSKEAEAIRARDPRLSPRR